MTNTYAINTTRGKEFEVEVELKAMGLQPWVPRRLGSRYVKEKRETVWYDRPYVPKLLFSVVPAICWRDIYDLRHVIGKPMQLSRLDIDGDRKRGAPGLREFQKAVDAEYLDAERLKENSQYLCQYRPGQALVILKGAFEGLPALFQHTVQRAHDDYAKLNVSVEIFGRETAVEIDPDQVGQVAR
ncbi:transcription termination/antitermination protein NusG [Phaeobacter inhibens]|uniref:transcription termination/antitermination protein NusG n=1 Tax=Phaeobacter inhibens TaxID=221822 RepID=UPI0021A607E2|nr:hypothetical protein [Phaeobacter inhibens]UWS06773.1 hypothetical protein K4K98_10935 [Phaeobacter inhibens]